MARFLASKIIEKPNSSRNPLEIEGVLRLDYGLVENFELSKDGI